MTTTRVLILVIISLIIGFFLRGCVDKPDDGIIEPPSYQKMPVGDAQVLTRNFMPDSATPTRAILIKTEMLPELVAIGNALNMPAVRVYYASSSPNDPKYDQLVIVGVDATGKDVFTTLKLGSSIQKSGFAQEDAEEEKADAVYYTQRSNKADIETCPKMCDVESPLMPEDGR